MRDEQKEGSWVKGGNGWERKETDTRPVSNQRSCGAEFKAGMGQTSKLLEFCHLSLPPPTSLKKGKKEKRGGRARGRKDVNENQTHSPVWSGREQWGGWCHKSGAGFSPYLFLRVAISPSSSVGPFFSHVSWFEILFGLKKSNEKILRSGRKPFPSLFVVKLILLFKTYCGLINQLFSDKMIEDMQVLSVMHTETLFCKMMFCLSVSLNQTLTDQHPGSCCEGEAVMWCHECDRPTTTT